MWHIDGPLFLGDYRSGELALEGVERPRFGVGELAPFAGVVSLCPMPLLGESLELAPRRPETEWLHTPIQDGGNGELELELTLGVVLRFVHRRRTAGNVLVHCAAGMSRSVAVMAALLCADGMELERALARIAKAKEQALLPFVSRGTAVIAPAREFLSCLARLYGRSPTDSA